MKNLTIHTSNSLSASGWTGLESDGQTVAEVYGSDKESQRLATLFASAPEMLEIVKEIVQYVEGNGLDRIPKEEACAEYFTCTLYYHFAKDLLSKVEGGE